MIKWLNPRNSMMMSPLSTMMAMITRRRWVFRFTDWMEKYTDLKHRERELKKRFVLGGHKAYYLMKFLQKVTIILVSVMPDCYAVNTFKMRTASAMNDAIRDAFELAGKNAKVYVMPHGSDTLPEYKSADQNNDQ